VNQRWRDLDSDLSETRHWAKENPPKVAELTRLPPAQQGCIKLTILSPRGTSGERTEARGNQ
jgi:hypothetical protein